MDSSDLGRTGDIETGRWILAIAKHLDAFAAHHPQLAYLYGIRKSSREGLLLLRLRGLGKVARSGVEALSLDVGIPLQEVRETLIRLESVTNLLSVRDLQSASEYDGVEERILTEQEVYRAVTSLFQACHPTSTERAMIPMIELMSRLPLTEEEVITRVCGLGFSEVEVRQALEMLEAFRLLHRQQVNDLGKTLLYNEYLWGNKIDKIGAVLAGLRRQETEDLLSLMQEVRTLQGQSLDRLSAAPPHIVALAARTGIIDTTSIVTASNDEKTFVFSFHFYGYRAGPAPGTIEDSADQVKLFVASISYGVNYSADFRLHSPIRFVERLYANREAGLATPILRDYVLLERQGIVGVEERAHGKGTFILLKPDVVGRALDVMKNGSLMEDSVGRDDYRGFFSQDAMRSPERNRLTGGFGIAAGDTKRFDHDILASIRETVQRGTW